MTLRQATLWVALCYLIACDGGAADVNFSPDSKSKRNAGTFGSGNLQGVDLAAGGNEYPVTEYYGNGNLVSITNNPIQVKTRQEALRDKITTYTLRFNSSDSHVDAEVRKLEGQTTYKRVPKEELASRGKDPAFKNVPFLMYVNESKAQNQNGETALTFNSPAPFLVIPTQMHHFDVLKEGPITYDYKVAGDGDFSVHATVEEESRSGDIIRVKVVSDIGSDDDGKLYDKFSMPRVSSYEIDTKDMKVLRIDTETFYYNKRKKKRKNMDIHFRLCRYTVVNKVDDQRPCGG